MERLFNRSLLTFLAVLLSLGLSSAQETKEPTLFETLNFIKDKIETMNLRNLDYMGDRVFYEEFFFLDCDCRVDFSGIKIKHEDGKTRSHRTILSFNLKDLEKVIQSVELDEQIDMITIWRQKKIEVHKAVEVGESGWKDMPTIGLAQYGIPVEDPTVREELINAFNFSIKKCREKSKKGYEED